MTRSRGVRVKREGVAHGWTPTTRLMRLVDLLEPEDTEFMEYSLQPIAVRTRGLALLAERIGLTILITYLLEDALVTYLKQRGKLVSDAMIKLYLDIKAKVAVHDRWRDDIIYCETRDLAKVSETDFLSEAAFVIFNSGMRASVVQAKWGALQLAFEFFRAAHVCHEEVSVRANALAIFNNERKVDAVIQIARILLAEGWGAIHASIASHGIDYLERFPMIGPITKYHLAKNIGFDCAKPDRHLVRIAEAAGYDSPEQLCKSIRHKTGDRLAVIDYVIWRYASSIDTSYVDVFKRARI